MAATLVPATAEQAPLLRKLFREVIDPLELYNQASRDFELNLYTERRFAEIISEEAYAVWLAYVDNSPVGFSVVEPDRDLWWYSWIGVTERSRGHRLGHQLITNTLDTAQSLRIRKISCVTRSENTEVISILHEVGFEKICDLSEHWFGQDYLLWQIKP